MKSDIITKTLKFNNWSNPEDGTVSDKIITFTNDGEFTTNTESDSKIPQDQESFNKIIKVYIDNNIATEIND